MVAMISDLKIWMLFFISLSLSTFFMLKTAPRILVISRILLYHGGASFNLKLSKLVNSPFKHGRGLWKNLRQWRLTWINHFYFFRSAKLAIQNELILNIYQATSKQQLSINSKYNIPDLKVSNYWTCSRSLASLKAVFYLKAFSIN